MLQSICRWSLQESHLDPELSREKLLSEDWTTHRGWSGFLHVLRYNWYIYIYIWIHLPTMRLGFSLPGVHSTQLLKLVWGMVPDGHGMQLLRFAMVTMPCSQRSHSYQRPRKPFFEGLDCFRVLLIKESGVSSNPFHCAVLIAKALLEVAWLTQDTRLPDDVLFCRMPHLGRTRRRREVAPKLAHRGAQNMLFESLSHFIFQNLTAFHVISRFPTVWPHFASDVATLTLLSNRWPGGHSPFSQAIP